MFPNTSRRRSVEQMTDLPEFSVGVVVMCYTCVYRVDRCETVPAVAAGEGHSVRPT